MGYYTKNSNLIGVAPSNRTGVHDLVNSQVNWEIVPDDLYLHLDAGRKSSYPGTGTTWYDLSGNGFHGTINTLGAGNILHMNADNSTYADSEFFMFFGSSNSQKISLGSSLDFGNQFSMCFLVRPLAKSDIQPVLCNIDPGALTEGFLFGWNTWGTEDRKFRVSVGEGSGSSYKTNVYSAADAFSVTPPEWMFLTVSMDKTNSLTTVRKNMTTVISSGSLGNRDFDVSGKDVTIGAYNSTGNLGTSYPLCGHISAILVYKRFITYDEQWHNFNYYKRRFGGDWA